MIRFALSPGLPFFAGMDATLTPGLEPGEATAAVSVDGLDAVLTLTMDPGAVTGDP